MHKNDPLRTIIVCFQPYIKQKDDCHPYSNSSSSSSSNGVAEKLYIYLLFNFFRTFLKISESKK